MAKNPIGRPKRLKTADELAELWDEFKIFVKSNPRKKHVFIGKEGRSDYELLEQPFTMAGFYTWGYSKHVIFQPYILNVQDRYKDFITISTRIKAEIRADQLIGGMVGQYNSSITARLNGLADKTENKHTNEEPMEIKIVRGNKDNG